jgi:FlaA1/EpsC-like NDP-sugar epimerase
MVAELRYEEITGNSTPNIGLEERDFTFLRGKTILVTGAGGSIGSRIMNQLAQVPDVNLMALDRDENALHSLSLAVSNTALFQETSYVLQDIRDKDGLDHLINESNPSLIIHCAALKHLSVLERYPREAVLTNVLGTKNLLDSAVRHKVPGFLNVSTDKAAEPISILGKTKRIAELLVIKQRLNGNSGFTNVRFGNVFNSKGSVIETFVHQILNDVAITLTDPQMKRYFMHIDEAAALAIKSAVLNSGDIHILDMGAPILMTEIINRIQKALNSNVEILVTGARNGEKLNEDLMNSFENLELTEISKIRVLASNHPGITLEDSLDIANDEEALSFIAKILV